jgi:hypothetical protein
MGGGGANVHETKICCGFFGTGLLFFWQEAAFWIPAMMSGSNLYRWGGPPAGYHRYRCYSYHRSDLGLSCGVFVVFGSPTRYIP